MTVIEKILDLMTESNITASKLTREIPLTNGLITQWKQGKQKPSLEAVNKIADYFDCSVDYLLGRTDNPNRQSTTNNISGSITGNNNSNNIVSSNLGSVVVHNGQESPLSEEANKLIEIYNALDVRRRIKLLDTAFTLEEEIKGDNK